MYFVLPGNDGAPVETLRYEALRMAVQDYELLRLVESKLPKAQAEAVIQQAIGCVLHLQNMEGFANPDPAKAGELYSLDAADYLAARRILITALE